MDVLVVEDDALSRDLLIHLIKKFDKDINIINTFDNIAATTAFLKAGHPTDLIFMDVQLSDGFSFEIFDNVELDIPVIFTSLHEEYALRAFRANSIDYLLKPISYEALKNAINKYEKLWTSAPVNFSYEKPPTQYKERFLVRFGDHLQSKPVEDIAYFYAEDKTTYLVQQSTQRRYILDYKMRTLETSLLYPKRFFRINRTFIINIGAILDVRTHTNGRLKVILNIPCDVELIVSRDKVNAFKNWLDM